MEYDPLKELVDTSGQQLPYLRNRVREDLDFNIIPSIVFNDGSTFIENCISGKEEFICSLFNHYYQKMNPLYYQDDPKQFVPTDFHVGIRHIACDKHLLFVQLPEEFMGSLEFCLCYIIVYETHEGQVKNQRFFCIQDSAYGWRRIGELKHNENPKFIMRSSGNFSTDISQICTFAFQTL